MNPSNRNHFVYKKFIKDTHRTIDVEGNKIQISTHPQVHHIHTTYLDNIENLSKKFLNEINEIKRISYEKYRHKVLGDWQTEVGNMIRRDWFEIIPKYNEPSYRTEVYIDGAYTDKTQNDPSAIMLIAYKKDEIIILNSTTKHMQLNELLKYLPRYFDEHNFNGRTNRIWIEPKASGKSLKSMLKAQGYNAIEIPNKVVSIGKIGRVEDIAPSVEAGKVKLLRGNWNENFLDEVEGFPNAKHDDQLDNLCYAVFERLMAKPKMTLKRNN